ncbi:MAG: S8 family peptidase [Bacteriovoracia bacterium]
MLKFRAVAKFSVATGLALTLGFGVTSDQAFALVQNVSSALKLEKTNPSEILLRNWGLDNKEQASHINARKAWKISRGDKKIIVAVIDTGIDATHPDLKDNICRKPGTDEYGFDFVTNKKNPEDKHGHGSHVAGIIGATGRGNTGASGVAPNICIMAVRYYSDTASGAQNLANTVKAINYAVDNGANIINYSGGGAEFSAAEMRAIQRAEAKGILFVAAAGNEYQNTDDAKNSYYPAAYGLTNIIAVAATNIRNQLLPSSNWGKKHVHVAAPGENVYSTLPKGRYGYLTGTSQATAYVSGLAALILSENPSLKPAEVREIIMSSTDKLANLEAKVASGGRINAYAALRMTLAKRDGKDSKVLAALDKEDKAQELAAAPQTKESTTIHRDVAFH